VKKEWVMWSGTVESIHVASAAAGPMQAVERAEAIPGVGLQGDRYATGQGTFYKPEPDYELTLIESEAVEALQRDYEIALAPGDARRNIVTRGVALNHLVGREFRVGDVQVRGIRLCEPCSHLQRLTGASVIKGLLHRGGLRAQILSQGTIRVGDAVRE
jgi:MOSC domain-containing protein YiiM